MWKTLLWKKLNLKTQMQDQTFYLYTFHKLQGQMAFPTKSARFSKNFYYSTSSF